MVRVHALQLERDTLLKPYFRKQRSGQPKEADDLTEGL